jgi:hypothetical protein
MFDFSSDTTDYTPESGREQLDFGDVVTAQYENNALSTRLSELRSDTAFQNSGDPYGLYVQLYTESSEQYFTELQGWLTGFTTATMMGDFSYIGPGNFPPVHNIPDFPVYEDYPEIQEPMMELQEVLETLPVTVVELGDNKEGGIVGVIQNIQEFINNIFEGLISLFGVEVSEAAEGTKEFAEAYYEGVAAEALSLVFTPEVINNWDAMSIADREAHITVAVYVLNDALGLDVANVIFEDAPINSFGYYRGFDNVISISTWMYDGTMDGEFGEVTLGALIDTIVHEVKHQFHDEYMDNPERFPVQFPQDVLDAWRENDANYISPKDDFIGYLTQPLEVSTNEFAERVMTQMGLGGLWQTQNEFWNG